MKRLVMILLTGLFCMSNVSYAGNGDLTVGGTLDMTSNANGFLPPRMSTSARGNISPSPGMLIYNTDDNAYNYYTSSGWKILAAVLPVHDNTGASSDYALAVGETAKIVYSSATSIPLHIATVDGGEYEINITGTQNGTANIGNTYLNPNDTTTNTIVGRSVKNLVESQTTTDTHFFIGVGRIAKCLINVTTGVNKNALAFRAVGDDNSAVRHVYGMFWQNDLVWTSLGTVVFPFAQSGRIVIRRIL